MTFETTTLLAILAMGLATYLTRVAGLWLVQRLNVTGRLKAALDALPPAILMAVVAPTVLTTGPAETIAAAVTAVAATRLPLLATITIGVVLAALLRHYL